MELMNKSRFFVPLFFLLAVASAALAQGNSLVGKWNGTLPNGIPVVAKFASNGKMQFEAKNPNAKQMLIIMKGSYRTAGNKMFVTWRDVAFQGTPAEAKSIEPQLKRQMLQQLSAGKEQVTTITWQGRNAFSTKSPQGKVSRFTRG